ncbi:MAG TPA: AAA family ATPase, partial [Thermohalobaculum sp.]|nr:AAA family ATPase [Thermohalobaculum sp.]
FGSDDFDDIVEEAVRQNCTPNQNVYVGAALRKPDIPPFGRCGDEDFFALPALYVDLDDAQAAIQVRTRYRSCPPTAAVVTGRHPHVRAQLWWRLESPEQDPEASRRQTRALATALGGDPTVCNPSRVMRLAGSIAWPLKPGRQMERTELQTFADGRPRRYYAERIARAFPPEEDKRDTPPSASDGGTSSLELGLHGAGVTVEAVMADIRTGRLWHNNMVRLVGHWIARGWSDEEILTAAGNLTLAGYTVDQTRQEVATMISGGREKWSVPNPAIAVDAEPASSIRLLDWTADRYAGPAKPIEWLCEGSIPLAAPVLLAAAGGLGKSYVALDLALQVAMGVCGLAQPRTILGGRVCVEGTAVIISAEDSFNTIHRRLNRLDPIERRLNRPDRLIVIPLPDAGGPTPLISAEGGVPAKTPFFTALKDQLETIDDLRLIVIDPLQAFVMADVTSDPAAGQFMWTAFSELCAMSNATVIVTHHMRKEGMNRIDSADDAREAIRGSTALVDGARLSYALWKSDEETARAHCAQAGLEYENGRIVNGAVVKANDEVNLASQIYIRQDSGLLVDCTDMIEPVTRATTPTKDQARKILEEIQRRFDAGAPFSATYHGGPRHIVPYLQKEAKLSKRQAENLLRHWLDNEVVEIALSSAKTKMQGLKVLRWL